MTKYSILILIIALRIIFHPSNTNTTIYNLTNLPIFTSSFSSKTPSNFLSIDGRLTDNKIELTWVVDENETAEKFEIEKSIDSKHFVMTALVFGTDKTNTDQYKFHEKSGNAKVFFRIRLIKKNKEIIYSKTIGINPVI